MLQERVLNSGSCCCIDDQVWIMNSQPCKCVLTLEISSKEELPVRDCKPEETHEKFNQGFIPLAFGKGKRVFIGSNKEVKDKNPWIKITSKGTYLQKEGKLIQTRIYVKADREIRVERQ